MAGRAAEKREQAAGVSGTTGWRDRPGVVFLAEGFSAGASTPEEIQTQLASLQDRVDRQETLIPPAGRQ